MNEQAASKTPEEFKELGNEAFVAKDFQKAVDLYSQAIKLDPSNHVFHSNRSASYGGLGNWEKAAEDAKECIRLDPSFVKGYYRLANAQIELKEYDKALATIRQGLGVDPNNPQLSKLMRMVKQLQAQLKKVASAKQASAAEQQQHQLHNSANASRQLDDAASRELQELQIQYSQTNQELNSVKVDLNASQREYKVAELTKSELLPLPAESKCFRSIGKIFLRSTKDNVLEHLDEQMEEHKKKESDMTQKIEYLERKIKSQRQNMEEILSPGGS